MGWRSSKRRRNSRQMEWAKKWDRKHIQSKFQTANNKVNTIDTNMHRVDLFAIEVQEWQKVEIDRAQQYEAIDAVEFVSNLG